MHRVVNTLDISAPPEAVFEVATDVERWPEFIPNCHAIRVLHRSEHRLIMEMTAGGFGLRATWVSDRELDPARSIRFRQRQGFLKHNDGEWSFETIPSGTRVTMIHDIDAGPGYLAGVYERYVMTPLFIHRNSQRALEAIRARVEGRRAHGGAR